MRRSRILKSLLLPLLVFACGAGSLFAQGYSYAHYDVKDGLAGSTVYRMAQDRDGFLWFATETGLSRFDGTHFRNFTTQDGLPDNEITNLFVDSRNRVWLIPFNSRIAYYWKGRIHDQQNDTVLAKVKISGTILSVAEDSAGDIMVHQNDCVSIIHPDGSTAHITEFNGKPIYGIVQVGLNKRSGFRMMIVRMDSKSYVADLDGAKLHIITDDIDLTHISNPLTSFIGPKIGIYGQKAVADGKDSLIFYDSDGVLQFDLRVPEDFTSLSHLDDSTVTLNTFKYTYLYDIRERKVTDSFLKDQAVNGVIRDSEGDLWFSTLGKGVYRLGSTEVANYGFAINNNNLAVASIAEYDSTLYVGCDHFHLWMIGRKSKSMRDIRVASDVTRGRITSIVRGNDKKLYLGADGGIYIGEGGEYKRQSYSAAMAIKSLSLLDDSLIMICSSAGVWRYYLDPFRLKDTIWLSRATCICLQGSTYYVGTLHGLYAVDKNTTKTSVYLGSQDKAFANRIAAIGVSPDGMLWIATDGDGLLGYKEGKVVARITRDQGLTSNICRNIFIADNNIWVGTDKGLNKIMRSATGYSITPFTSADGLNSDIINAIYVSGSDVFVGTPEGLNYFNENKLSNISECKLRILGVTISDEQWPPDSSNFTLAHQHNNIKFDFVGISFKSAGSITYLYRLIGLDDKWKTTDLTSLSYPSLPSGKYELQLQAINKFGVRSNLAHIGFVIERSLWEKGWFRVALLLLFAGLIGWIFNYRVRLVMRKEVEKADTIARMTELEQMALRSQMNPHFIFNCLNSIQDYVMNRDVRGVNEFITNFSRLIRLTLDLSTRSRISLSEEVNYLSTYLELEKRRFENKFVYEVTIAEEIDAGDYHIPPMILQPYVENSIRHGINNRKDNKGRIRIRMELGPDHLICSIEDNGVGRRQSAHLRGSYPIEYQSRGMALTAKRVEMFNKTNRSLLLIEVQDLEDAARRPAGTRIILRFPFSDVKG